MKIYQLLSKDKINSKQLADLLTKFTGLLIIYKNDDNKLKITGSTSLLIGRTIRKIGFVHLEYEYEQQEQYYNYTFYQEGNGHYLLYHLVLALAHLGYVEVKEEIMQLLLPIHFDKISFWHRLFNKTYLTQVGDNTFSMKTYPDYWE